MNKFIIMGAALLSSSVFASTNMVIPDQYNSTDLVPHSTVISIESFVVKALRIIESENKRILGVRKTLTDMVDKKKLTVEEQELLSSLYTKYKVKDKDIASLILKVDAVPPALILAHGIYHLNTSKDIFTSLNYFQKPCLKEDCLIDIETLEYGNLGYSDVYTSIEEYMFNINVNEVFSNFRHLRSIDRSNGYLDSEKYLYELRAFFPNGDIGPIRKIFSDHQLWVYDPSTLLN